VTPELDRPLVADPAQEVVNLLLQGRLEHLLCALLEGSGRQPAARGSQDQAIGHPPARPWSCALEDEQLLAEDEDFEIAIGSRAAAEDKELDQQAKEGLEEGQQHGEQSRCARAATQAAGCPCPMASGRLGEVSAIKPGVGLRAPDPLPVVVDE
jgi:hypothetical protein